jgi:hypothetical protein
MDTDSWGGGVGGIGHYHCTQNTINRGYYLHPQQKQKVLGIRIHTSLQIRQYTGISLGSLGLKSCDPFVYVISTALSSLSVLPHEDCSQLLTLVSSSRIFLPWKWRWYFPPKRQFTQIYTATHPRRRYYSYSPPWKPQILHTHYHTFTYMIHLRVINLCTHSCNANFVTVIKSKIMHLSGPQFCFTVPG